MIFGEKNWRNIRRLKATLILFELISGLRVNNHKILLVGVNLSDYWLVEASVVLNCKIGQLSFVYLGLPIGRNQQRLSFWNPLVMNIRKRLSAWKRKNISMCGQLVLIKHALSSLPVYFLSFFKAPTCIISIIESFFKSFFMGGSEEARKIHWINWDKVCSSKENGDLRVRRIREFNISLF